MDKLTWQAQEFEQPERHPNWFVSLWILAAALVVGAVILKSYLLAVFIVISAGVINIYALKEPHHYTFILDTETLSVGSKKYNLADFTHFWIFERENGNFLVLEGKKILNSHLEIPLANTDTDAAKRLLLNTIEEKEIEESLIDLLAKKLKF